MTIQNLKDDGQLLESQVRTLCEMFEQKYGEGVIYNLALSRYNGSNWSSGPIVKVNLEINFNNVNETNKPINQ